MAEELGKRLLAEVRAKEANLDEVFRLLRADPETVDNYFNLAPFDRLLTAIAIDANTKLSTNNNVQQSSYPIVELSSLASGSGKTHLTYLLCALAVLPKNFGGRQCCTAVIDSDGTFSVSQLVAHMKSLLKKHDSILSDEALKDIINTALKHVHIFRPQSLGSMIGTIQTLAQYLFNNTRHHSFERAVGFLAIDSASAFYWQDRAETENAAFLASTAIPTAEVVQPQPAPPPPPISAYAELASSLRESCRILNCPAVVTTWHLGPTPAMEAQGRLPRSVRPALPASWHQLPTLRLLLQRLPVRKFPPGISVEEAFREAEDRRNAVEGGRFECVVNEWGLDDRVVMGLREAGGVFEFTIGRDGVLAME